MDLNTAVNVILHRCMSYGPQTDDENAKEFCEVMDALDIEVEMTDNNQVKVIEDLPEREPKE